MPSSPDDPTADNNNDSNASPDEDNMNIDENFQNNSNNSDRQRVGQQHQNNSQHRTDSGIKVDKENDSIDSEQNVIPLRYAVNDAYALLDVKLFSNVDDRDDEMDAVVVDPFHDAALASTLEQQDRRLIHLRKQKQQQHNSQHQNPQHPNYHNHPPKPLTAHQMRQHIPMSSRAMNDSHRQPPPKTPSHLDSHPDLRIHLICEYCLINGARPFASGIFCSARCARGSAASGRSRGRVRGRGRWTRLKGGRQPNVNNTSGTIHDPMADHRSHAVGGTNGDDARDTLSKRRRDMNEPKEGSSSLQQDNDHENTVYVGPDGVAEHCMVRKSNRQRKRPAALIMDDPNVSGASIDDVIGPDSKSQLANNDDMDIKPATTSVVIPLTSQVLAAKHGATSSSPLISTTNGSTQHATKRARSSKDVSIHGTKQGKRDLNDPNGKQGFHNASNGSMMIMNEPYRKNGSAKDKSKQRSNGNIVVGGPHPGANNNGGRGGLRSNGNTKHPGTSSTHVGDAATTGRPAAASSSGNLGLYQNLNTGLNPNASSGSLMKPGKGYKFCHNCDKLIANRRFVCTGCGTENPSAKKGLPRFTGGKESKDGMDIDTNTDVNGIGKVVKNVNSSGKVVKSKTKTKDEKDGKKKKKKRKSTKDKAKETEKDKDQGNLKKPIKLRIVVPGKKRSDNSYNSSNYSLNNSIGKKKTEAVKDHHHHHINKSSSNRNVDRAPNIYNGGGGGEHDFDDDVGSNDNNVEQANNKKDEVKSTSPPSWRGETWLSARDVRVLRTLGYESARDFVSQPPLAGFGSAKGKDGLKLEERCWALYRRVLDKLQVPKPRGSGLVSNNEDAKNSVHGDEFGEYDNGPGAAAVADRDNVDDNDNMDNDDDDMDDDDDDDNGDLSSDDREEEDIEVEGLEEDENEPDHHAHHHHRDRHSRENDSDSSSDERDDDDDDDGDGDDNGDNRRQHVAHNDDGEDEDVVDINKNGNENDHYDSESDRGSGWYDEDARPAAAAASRYNVEYMDRHATYHPNGKYSGRQEEEDSFHSEHPSQSESPRHHEGRQDDDDVLDSRYGADQQQQRPDDDGSGGDSDDGGDSSEGDMNNDEGRQQQQREKEGRRSPSQQQQGVENDTPVVAATAAARSKDDGSGIGAQDVNVNGRGRSSKPYREDGLRLRLVLGGKS